MSKNASKNRDFSARSRRPCAQKRSLYGINNELRPCNSPFGQLDAAQIFSVKISEHSSTRLTQRLLKKIVFGGVLDY